MMNMNKLLSVDKIDDYYAKSKGNNSKSSN